MSLRPDPALVSVWYARAAMSGFDDIERPPARRSGVSSGRHAAYYQDYLRPEDSRHQAVMLPLEALLLSEDNRSTTGVAASDIELWDHGAHREGEVVVEQSRLQDFARRELVGKDREIAEAIARGGQPYSKRLKRRLRVGQDRIERVIRQVIQALAVAA